MRYERDSRKKVDFSQVDSELPHRATKFGHVANFFAKKSWSKQIIEHEKEVKARKATEDSSSTVL